MSAKSQYRGGVCPPKYINGYICGHIRAGKPCPYKLFDEMRTFIFLINPIILCVSVPLCSILSSHL